MFMGTSLTLNRKKDANIYEEYNLNNKLMNESKTNVICNEEQTWESRHFGQTTEKGINCTYAIRPPSCRSVNVKQCLGLRT